MYKYVLTLLIWNVSIISASVFAGLDNSTQLMAIKVKSLDSIYATLQRFQRKTTKDDSWQKVGDEIPVLLGRQGVAYNKKEGDAKTPVGRFQILAAFGIMKNGSKLTKMPYIQISPTIFCIDRVESEFYNRIIDKSKIEEQEKHDGEEMFQYKTEYNLGLVVDYNKNPSVPGKGSCIFVHVWQNPDHATGGCIAMSEDDLKTVFVWLDPAGNPIISVGDGVRHRLCHNS